jgi:hypothetical protein
MKVVCDISVTSGRWRPASWSPAALFAGGAQGVWYDPSDPTNLFQDVDGTVPVSSDGDPVALVLDKSGRGNHATQSVVAARPIYRTDGTLHWLEYDGVDDRLKIPAISYSSSMVVCVGLQRVGGTGWGSFRSPYVIPPTSYCGLSHPNDNSSSINNSGGTDRVDGSPFSGTRSDLFYLLQQPRVGTAFGNTDPAVKGEGTFLAYGPYTPPGRVFAYVEIEMLSTGDLPQLKRWVATKTGATL